MAIQKGEGFEYFILMLGLAVSLVASGAGGHSIDSWIANKKYTNTNMEYSQTANAVIH